MSCHLARCSDAIFVSALADTCAFHQEHAADMTGLVLGDLEPRERVSATRKSPYIPIPQYPPRMGLAACVGGFHTSRMGQMLTSQTMSAVSKRHWQTETRNARRCRLKWTLSEAKSTTCDTGLAYPCWLYPSRADWGWSFRMGGMWTRRGRGSRRVATGGLIDLARKGRGPSGSDIFSRRVRFFGLCGQAVDLLVWHDNGPSRGRWQGVGTSL